jgi:hypothetical protein
MNQTGVASTGCRRQALKSAAQSSVVTLSRLRAARPDPRATRAEPQLGAQPRSSVRRVVKASPVTIIQGVALIVVRASRREIRARRRAACADEDDASGWLCSASISPFSALTAVHLVALEAQHPGKVCVTPVIVHDEDFEVVRSVINAGTMYKPTMAQRHPPSASRLSSVAFMLHFRGKC